MGIAYNTAPRNFDELVDSVRGQLERSRELHMMGETISYEEAVELTSESFMGLLDRITELSAIVASQALLFSQINEIFHWLFESLGIPITEDSDDIESE